MIVLNWVYSCFFPPQNTNRVYSVNLNLSLELRTTILTSKKKSLLILMKRKTKKIPQNKIKARVTSKASLPKSISKASSNISSK